MSDKPVERCQECYGYIHVSKCCQAEYDLVVISSKEVTKENGDIVIVNNTRNKCLQCNKLCKLNACQYCFGTGEEIPDDDQ